MTTLAEFLQTGRLGPLTIGMRFEDVRAMLGEPDYASPEQRRGRAAWIYGGLQLYFRAGELVVLVVEYPFNSSTGRYTADICLPNSLHIAGYFPGNNTTIEEVKAFLVEHRIGCYVDTTLSYGVQLTILAGIGVNITFNVEHNAIIAMSYSGTDITRPEASRLMHMLTPC
jgi:hypothetical protein